jgi:hypothetical protein
LPNKHILNCKFKISLCFHKVEDLHYDDFFDALHEDGDDQAVQLEKETEWGEVEEEEEDKDVTDGLSNEEDTSVKNFR